MSRVVSRWRAAGGRVAPSIPAPTEALRRVHDARYVDAILSTAGKRVRLDPDAYASLDSEAIARRAAGAAMAVIDHALDHDAPALALVRPPRGHNAERERAMGFRLYKNVAIAAAHALARGVTRVAVVDYDVHHGNGTQWIFYDDARVLYLPTHQYPFYLGTGAVGEVGRGDTADFTVNIPLVDGAGDAGLDLVFLEIAVQVLTAFDSEVTLLSAGYDAHADDPAAARRSRSVLPRAPGRGDRGRLRSAGAQGISGCHTASGVRGVAHARAGG